MTGAGWEMLFVTIDDHARFVFRAMPPDENAPQEVRFLRDATAYYAGLGVRASSGSSPTTAPRFARASSRGLARRWALCTISPGPTDRKVI